MKKNRTKIIVYVFVLLALMASVISGNTVRLLTDIKAAYVYDEPEKIDWALVYYLGMQNGCQVDLVSVKEGPVYKWVYNTSEEYNLSSSRFFIPETTQVNLKAMSDDLFGEYVPDLVIFSDEFNLAGLRSFERYLLDRVFNPAAAFSIKKYYRMSDTSGATGVHLKSKRYYNNYGDIITEMAQAVGERAPSLYETDIYSNYELVKSNIGAAADKRMFLPGIDRFKFDRVIAENIESRAQQTALKMNRENFMSNLNNAFESSGMNRIQSLIKARDELKKIRQTYYYQVGRVDTLSPIAAYIEKTLDRLSSAVFYEAGIDYIGQTVIRETAEGRKLKFRSEINNNGLLKIQGGRLEYRPSWMDTIIVVDSTWTDILPNNSLIREYVVGVDPDRLASLTPQSIEFIGRVRYGANEVDFRYQAGEFERSDFRVEFMPGYVLIKPFERLRADRIVEQSEIKALITKPIDFYGNIEIDISTPQFVTAGSFPERAELRAGQRAFEISIPLASTKSLGERRQEVTLNVSSEGRIVGSDVAYIRQVEYDIPTEKYIALLPGIDGSLEDVLIQTGANYKAVSNHYLKVGDLGVYDAILIGTGAFSNYEFLPMAFDKLKRYLELGGTIIVFGQPDDWRDDLLPVSIVSTEKKVSRDEARILVDNHRLLSAKYNINRGELLDAVAQGYIAHPGLIFPGEKIIGMEEKSALLSISKIGEGQLIYCGLPIVEMVGNLDVEAIKLFSNLLHY